MYKIVSIAGWDCSISEPLTQSDYQIEKLRWNAICPILSSGTALPVIKPAKQIDIAVQETRRRLAQTRSGTTQKRLQKRLHDFSKLKRFFKRHSDVEMLGFYGWGKGCQVRSDAGKGVSQYDAIIYRKNGKIFVEQIGSSYQLFKQAIASSAFGAPPKPRPIASEIATLGGRRYRFSREQKTIHYEYLEHLSKSVTRQHNQYLLEHLDLQTQTCSPNKGLINLAVKVDSHGDHSHFSFSKPSQHDISLIGQDEEGCPCCMAGLDFDEFAAAIKHMVPSENTDSHDPFRLANFDSGLHWLAIGVGTPFALIGLTAAIRNIKGSWTTRKNIKRILREVQRAISELKASPDDHQVLIDRLNAFKYCLKYSKLDADFNLAVPGVVNGVASSLVLGATVAATPLALSAIALYATCQTIRNGYDLARNWNTMLRIDPAQDSAATIVGKKKTNQITRSKRLFHSANIAGFVSFGAGAVLTIAGIFIPPLLIPGLLLLGGGASLTGVINNRYPRKFRPRNGDLGEDRSQLTCDSILKAIGHRRLCKLKLQSTRRKLLGNPKKWLKRWYKLRSALPYYLEKWNPTEKKHRLNRTIVRKSRHQNLDRWRDRREKTLGKLIKIGQQNGNLNPKLPEKKGKTDLEFAWDCLTELGETHDVTSLFLQDLIDPHQARSGHSHGTEDPFKDDEVPLLPGKHHHHRHSSETTPSAHSCRSCSHSAPFRSFEDLANKLNSSPFFKTDWLTQTVSFDIQSFVQEAPSEKLESLLEIIDFYLLFILPKKMQYQQYGLNDYFWALKKTKSNH